MEMKSTKEGDVLIFEPEGRIHGTNARDVETAFLDKVRGGELVILVDFSEVDFISSAGLRVLLMVAKEVKARSGRIELCSMRDYLKEVFEVSGFNAIFQIHEARSDGLASLS